MNTLEQLDSSKANRAASQKSASRVPKLLVVTTIAATARAFLLPYAEHFRSMGWKVDLLANRAPGSPECAASYDSVFDIDWSRNPLAFGNLRALRRIRDVFANNSYDLVHVHTPVSSFLTRFALRSKRKATGTAVIYTAHGFHFHTHGSRLQNCFFLSLEKIAAPWTDSMIVMNQEDYDAALRYKLVDKANLHFTRGIGVNPENYSGTAGNEPQISDMRRALGLGPDDFLFLMVAEFTARKRQADAVRALAVTNSPTFHIAFAGEGPTLEKSKRLATELGIESRTHFLGKRDDIPALLHASNALLLTSSHEGLPRSVLEALCAGVPVIGSDVRGTRDLLAHGAGVLFPTGDVSRLAAAMRQIASHPDAARCMGERGRAQAAGYAIDPLLLQHERIYSDVLRTKSGVDNV